MYIGGDQNPLRQGFLRAMVMAQRVGEEQVFYLIQDVDAIAGGKAKRWELTGARRTYFPFCWDLWGHPEYPGCSLGGADSSRHAQNQARLRGIFGYPRLIVVGPESNLLQGAVSAWYSRELWLIVQQAFVREINWALGLNNCVLSRQRAAKIMQLVSTHPGSLTELVLRIGFYILPALAELHVETVSSFYKKHEPKVLPSHCWVVSGGKRERYQEGAALEGILVPKGQALVDDLRERGFSLYGTHIPYLDPGVYTRVFFKSSVPVDWTNLMQMDIGAGWENWGKRPTLISAYVLGGRALIDEILRSARVEGL